MNDNFRRLRAFSAQYGTYFGLYWIALFVLYLTGLTIPLIELLFFPLFLASPIVGFFCVRDFRNRYWREDFSFLQAFTFSLRIYLYAALLVAVAEFVYFQFIDHDFLFNYYNQAAAELAKIEQMKEMSDTVQQLLKAFEEIRPIELVMTMFFQSIFYGSIFSLVTALILKGKWTPKE